MEINGKRNSIFDIERRICLQSELVNLINYMKRTPIVCYLNTTTYLYGCVDKTVQDWKYRGTAFNLREYLLQIGIDTDNDPDYLNDAEVLCVLELIANLLSPTVERIEQNYDYDTCERVNSAAKKVTENIIWILEKANMQLSVIDDKHIIRKRDVDVDATLEVAPELSEVLLGYLDFRNQDDTNYKRTALKLLADSLEPKKKEYSGKGTAALYDTAMFAFNNFSIRHNNNHQVGFLDSDECNRIYDILFKLALYLLRSEEATKWKNEIDQYKEK